MIVRVISSSPQSLIASISQITQIYYIHKWTQDDFCDPLNRQL